MVILVIDDHGELLTVIQRVLEGQGYTVLTATNGVEGLGVLMARKGNVAAVIVDLYMPKLGGAHFAELIRIAWPDLPMLVISAYAEAALPTLDRLQLTVLRKPFTVTALVDAIRALLE